VSNEEPLLTSGAALYITLGQIFKVITPGLAIAEPKRIYEKDLPTKPYQTPSQTRIPRSHGHAKWTTSAQAPSR
jgi:hypothetical protein